MTTKTIHTHADVRELSATELDHVSGGSILPWGWPLPWRPCFPRPSVGQVLGVVNTVVKVIKKLWPF